jgi:hypothetical protein
MKNSNDTIGNRTRDLPACSAAPQLVPQRAPRDVGTYVTTRTRNDSAVRVFATPIMHPCHDPHPYRALGCK